MAKKEPTSPKVTFDSTYNDKPILTDKEKGYGCREDILKKIDKRLDHATQKHSKVLCTRMDFRFPTKYDVPSDNKLMSSCLAKFTRNLKRNGNDPHYVCVREQSREKHQHYHLALITNQKKHQFPHKHIEKAEELWASTLGVESGKGLVDHCTTSRSGEQQQNCYRLNRNDPDFEQVKAECFQRCSYLAKENTKGNAPKHKREVMCSRLKQSDKR